MVKADLKRGWQPTEASFHRLLAWLDQGADSHGERYLEIRDRLVQYFARRNRPAPDDLADETLNRVARRLEETGSIDDVVPARYCYISAKFVLLESLRHEALHARVVSAHVNASDASHAEAAAESRQEAERTLACLERCLDACTSIERQIILEYYKTEAGSPSVQRKQLAQRLGLTPNSLAIRACRIRSRLEACVRACIER